MVPYTQAPMKLLYDVARALQIIAPRQMMLLAMYVTLRPKEVLIGTLFTCGQPCAFRIEILGVAHIPDEITEPKHEDSDTSKLDSLCKRATELGHVDWKSRGKRQRTETLDEGNRCGCRNGHGLPFRRPVERVVRIVRRLGDQDTGPAFDEVMRSDIRHDLGTGQDLGMELLLELVELLRKASVTRLVYERCMERLTRSS